MRDDFIIVLIVEQIVNDIFLFFKILKMLDFISIF